ncbi:MAG: prepilin peptidase [Lachnospiraceae bacterium]|nr:prepilin peptidase [Lachnospiraceae bacterium]
MVIHLVLNAASLFGMTVLSIEDILHKSIKKWMVFLFIISGLVISCLVRDLSEIFRSVLPGMFLLILGSISGEKIGYGDGLTTVGLGLWAGYKSTYIAVFAGILMSFASSVIYVAVTKILKKKRQDNIPFIPFLMAGLVVSIIYG